METLQDSWLDFFRSSLQEDDWWRRKQNLYREREAEIVRISGQGHVYEELRHSGLAIYRYLLHITFLVKQQSLFFREEQVIPFQFRWANGKIMEHKPVKVPFKMGNKATLEPVSLRELSGDRFSYDRRVAVQYAERWWNSYNPAYRKFDVDCTNYVSQCMHAGGAPMRGAPDRGSGWWYQNDNWSYSWAVAHSLRWYLSGSTSGLKGKEMESARDLIPGDIICYDFEGDGNWNHNTIVVSKDADEMPLVNAHTDNSRNRYWSYEDSTAWTPDIQYKFFRIGE
ncbi:amidase domain-containing protein [Lentibacillus jeotgali]|uniref:amidase domain-containing protein n=1 Tax=Lentibacillus jeotgali TaxID=558169 RepID=UPI0002626810|nr:amidase domain-containing protein [Lentibacillus jeotgali]